MEFTEWMAYWQLTDTPQAPVAEPVVVEPPRPRTDDDLLAQAIAWRDKVNSGLRR